MVEAEPLRKNGRWDYESMDGSGILALARRIMREGKMKGREDLRMTDHGTYNALKKRNLLDEIERMKRDWNAKSDTELVEFARRFVEEKGISFRVEMIKTDYRLYRVLKRRGLVDKIGFERKRREGRKWAYFSDDEFIEFAKKFIETKLISSSTELCKIDQGLYRALIKRRLLDSAFGDVRGEAEHELLGQLAEAVDKYTEKN
jgi:hypothetical protein